MKRIFFALVVCLLPFLLIAQSKDVKPKVTFVELGSVNCIPCKQMQPVMKSIEEKYGKQIEVIFYDVWKADQKEYAQKYGIRLIPTQVFLDENGKEFHRHEGFYPEAEIDKLLKIKGLKPKEKKG
ncbi:thioredoxin family protein [Bacteroidota bacterium]